MTAKIIFRRLHNDECASVLPLVRQLRSHLDEAEFLRRLALQETRGYELHAAIRDGVVVGLAGFRPVMTLARGAHLHLDDLVVAEGLRSGGIGKALIGYAEGEARRRGLGKLFLDARQQAIPFYQREGYDFHHAPLMAKSL
jgi:GNAT superfamily N-acetyltransferase